MEAVAITNKTIPKHRRQAHKSGGRAFVMLDGKSYYLGEYGSPESQGQYRRLMPPEIKMLQSLDMLLRESKQQYTYL